MKHAMRKAAHLLHLLRDEAGQDLIEYALACALIALAATAGMRALAADINQAFTSIGSELMTYTSGSGS